MGHTVALAVIYAPDGQPLITARCECGWKADFTGITTYLAVSEEVTLHLIDAWTRISFT
jgi:hypothetical protein